MVSGVDLSQDMGVRISQVKPSNCFRRIEKLLLPSIFDTSLSSLMTWNLRSYPATFLNERTWHFSGVKTYSDPSTYFQAVKTTQSPGSVSLGVIGPCRSFLLSSLITCKICLLFRPMVWAYVGDIPLFRELGPRPLVTVRVADSQKHVLPSPPAFPCRI